MKQRKVINYSHTYLLKISALMWIVLMAMGCNPTKYLAEDESLLKKNTINFLDPDNLKETVDLKYDLSRFYEQEPNGKFLSIFPREWYYFRNSEPGDSSWYNNWVREDIGERPSIHELSETETSAQNMELYLKNIMGYFHAKVDHTVVSINKHTRVDYQVQLGPRYKINSIQYLSKDKSLLSEVHKIQSESRLTVGNYIDANIFNQEKNQITKSLQNSGYANFLVNYIDIKADSTRAEQALDFYIEILTPTNRDSHQKYKIGDINLFTDYHSEQDSSSLSKYTAFDKNFYREADEFIIKPSALDKMIFLNKGELYKRDNRYKTNRKLSTLGTYKFVNLTPYAKSEQDSLLNYNIILSPFEKKWVLDYGTDVFYSTINSTGRKLIGFLVGGSLVNRNLFGGAEKNTLTTEVGVEFELSNPVRTNTLTLGLQDQIEFPRYINTFSTINLINKLGFIKDDLHQKIKDEARTTINGGYTFQKVIDWRDKSSFNLSYGYTFRPDNNQQLDFRQIGFTLNQYDLKSGFPDDNQLLLLSFQNNLFTGFLFRELTYFKRWRTGRLDEDAYTLISSLEISGLEIYGLNKLYNGISGSSNVWKVNNNLDFSNFFRFQIDGRYYKKVSDGSTLASRVYAGIVVPYADDIVNPYIKQLYVGGPNSIRAWQSRELGPGGFSDLLIVPEENQLFYQAGDIKFEMNAEYRFDLFWYLEGAFFIDAGNVWTLKSDDDRDNVKISSSFYEQIAVGGGWGIRWDFTYFIIRTDFAYKIRNPYAYPGPVEQSPWVFDFNGFGNVNIAVNYPF